MDIELKAYCHSHSCLASLSRYQTFPSLVGPSQSLNFDVLPHENISLSQSIGGHWSTLVFLACALLQLNCGSRAREPSLHEHATGTDASPKDLPDHFYYHLHGTFAVTWLPVRLTPRPHGYTLLGLHVSYFSRVCTARPWFFASVPLPKLGTSLPRHAHLTHRWSSSSSGRNGTVAKVHIYYVLETCEEAATYQQEMSKEPKPRVTA